MHRSIRFIQTMALSLGIAALYPLGACSSPASAEAATGEIAVVVDGGYSPSRLDAKAGERLRIRFVRKDDGPCTSTVEFPTLDIVRELPAGKETVVELPPLKEGEVPFHCSMKMVTGVIVVTKP